MGFEYYVEHYGYLAILIGTFLEGETILIAGGFLAHRGHLNLPLVILAAFAGSLAGDQLYFFIGRLKGRPYVQRIARLRSGIEKADALLARHGKLLMLGFRFVYGIRTATPFALGAGKVEARTFAFYNSIGALVWAASIGALGYAFGQSLELLIADIKRYELETIIAVAASGALFWLYKLLR